jgi:uncharacterized membrane protein HdeD (DUF308 family)
MSSPSPLMSIHPVLDDVVAMRRNWGWLLVYGIALILLGGFALSSSLIATLATMIVFGWLLVAGGVLEIIAAFGCRAWGGFFLMLLAGVLALVAGFFALNHPADAAVGYTLLLAVAFCIGGLTRMLMSFATRFHGWIWVFLNGAITLALGIMIWRQWPVSGLWVVGLFVGIDFIFRGWSYVMTALMIRNVQLPA